MATAKSKRKPKKNPRPRRAPIAKKRVAKKRVAAQRPAAPMPADLNRRLLTLARRMNTTLAAVTLQALCEFADAWEDHFRTVDAEADGDRVRISVKPE